MQKVSSLNMPALPKDMCNNKLNKYGNGGVIFDSKY